VSAQNQQHVFQKEHRKEGRLEATGEKLLQDLVNQEKSVVAKVEAAKEQAAKIVQDAYAEAAALKAKATERAEAIYKDVMSKAQGEAEAARAAIVKKASEEVSSIESMAKNNLAKAVQVVIGRVLP
jgi:V/A-type H+-transporting ATPase subunit G/H